MMPGGFAGANIVCHRGSEAQRGTEKRNSHGGTEGHGEEK